MLGTLVAAADRVLAVTGPAPRATTTNERPTPTDAAGPVSMDRTAVGVGDHDHDHETGSVDDIVYRRRSTTDASWVVQRWDRTVAGWLSRPLDPRATSPYPWTVDGRRSLMKDLLSDVLDIARHGATLPMRGGDTLLAELIAELLPADDTAFDLAGHRLDDCSAHTGRRSRPG
jgi:hypothetical protein